MSDHPRSPGTGRKSVCASTGAETRSYAPFRGSFSLPPRSARPPDGGVVCCTEPDEEELSGGVPLDELPCCCEFVLGGGVGGLGGGMSGSDALSEHGKSGGIMGRRG